MELIVKKHGRIDILDAIRGVAILSMVFYHALYDLQNLFGVDIGCLEFLDYLVPPFAGAFILLAGVSCRFSHNNLKRGLRVLIFAVLVTLATVLFMPAEAIYFGILHFMGCAILIFFLTGKFLDRIPPKIALPLWILLFILTCPLPDSYAIGIPGLLTWQLPVQMKSIPGLFAFGLPDSGFTSADYFPLAPWFFLFMAGTVIGIPIRRGKLRKGFYTARIPFFAAAGRNSLLIYVLHQPVIYGLLSLLFSIMRKG